MPNNIPQPVDYDAIEINVAPNVLLSLGDIGIQMEADFIAGYIGRVGDLWDSLKISWVGTTANEAQEFNARWDKSMTALFGRKGANPDVPSPSGENILGRIGAAVHGAALNFAWADQNVVDMFGTFKKGDSTSPPGGNPPPSDVTETGPGSG